MWELWCLCRVGGGTLVFVFVLFAADNVCFNELGVKTW